MISRAPAAAASLALLLVAAPAVAQPPTPTVTLDALRARPGDYAGRTVRVAGQLDQCWNMSCNLCPLEATRAEPLSQRCLALSFERFRAPQGDGPGADMDSAFRYADLVVTARFDPACLDGLCTDRATVLRDARVEAVTRRRRSSEGLMHSPDPLLAAPAAAARPVRALIAVGEDDSPTRVFAVGSDPRLTRNAIVCRAYPPAGEAASWPTSWQGAITARSTEDPYRCLRAVRQAGRWRIEPS